MPATERAVEITETLGAHRPFRAIIKQNGFDFIVQEVMLDSKVAQINRLPPVPKENSKNSDIKPTIEKEKKSSIPIPIELTDKQYFVLDAFFPAEVDDQPSVAVKNMMTQIPSVGKEAQAVLPPCMDKILRAGVHNWVRDNLPGFMSDTLSTPIKAENTSENLQKQQIRIRPISAVCPSKRRRSDRDPSYNNDNKDNFPIPRGAPVQFKIWKRDMETNIAILKMSKILRTHVSSFSYAGTKDKRGITTQVMRVQRADARMFIHINRAFAPSMYRERSLAVGDVEVAPWDERKGQMSLGDLKGNRFTIVLRDVEDDGNGSDDNLKIAVESLKEYGFVNYFGMQRFGSGVSATHETGFAVLKEDYKEVCRRLLLPLLPSHVIIDAKTESETNGVNKESKAKNEIHGDDDEGNADGQEKQEKQQDGRGNQYSRNNRNGIREDRKNMIEALQKFAKEEISATSLLKQIPTRMFVERKIASSLSEDERNNRLPFNYEDAFYSLPRNLRSMYPHAVQSYLWNLMASIRIKLHPPNTPDRMHAIAGDLITLQNMAGDESFSDQESLNYLCEVREVTEEEEKDRAFSVRRVVLPAIGSKVHVPQTKWGIAASTVLEKEGVCWLEYVKKDRFLKGAYRPLIAMPKDVEWKIVEYERPGERLVPIGIEHLPFDEMNNGRVEKKMKKNEEGEEKEEIDVKKEATTKVVEDVKEKGVEGGEPKSHGNERNGFNKDLKEIGIEHLPSDENNNDRVEEKRENNEEREEKVGLGVDMKVGAKAGEEKKEDMKEVESNGNEKENEPKKKALVLSFTLKCAQYATMFVRELTKQDSSTTSQKELQGGVN